MMRTRILATAALVTAATVILSGCSTGGESGDSSSGAAAKDITLAGVAFNASDPFWVTLMCGGTREAKKEGVTLSWAAGNTPAVAEQQTNLDSALLKNPDALVFGPASADPFSGKVSDLMAEGTPVISVNLNMNPDTAYQTIMSSKDNAEFIKFVLGDIGDSGTIGVLGGIAGGSAVLVNRWKPLVEQLKATAPNVKVLDTQFDDFDRNKATSITAGLITANPDLKAIYAVSGPEGEGAAAAVEEAGKTGTIKVYAYDATPGEVGALNNGTITALLAQPAGLIGAQGVKAAIDYVTAHPDKKAVTTKAEAVQLPLKVLTKENIGDAASKDYIYSTKCDA